MSRLTAYAFSFAQLDGGEIGLADFAGKAILVVNTPRCADTRRSTRACRNYGPDSTTAA